MDETQVSEKSHHDVDSSTLKEITVETDYKNNYYELIVESLANNKVNVELNFTNKMYETIKNDVLSIVSGNCNFTREIEKDTIIKGLDKGKIKLLLNNSVLVKFSV